MKLFGSDTNSGMIRKFSDWFGLNFNPNESGQYESIRMNPFNLINWNLFIRSIQINPTDSEKFGLPIDWIYRIQHCKFGFILIYSDSIGLQVRIDF